MQDTTSSVYRSILQFFSGTAMSRATGLVRDIVMAFCFGTTPEVAAFFLAFRLTHLLRRVFGEGALQSAFIPLFEEKRHQSQNEALQFYKSIERILALFLIGLTLCFIGLMLGSFYMIDWSEGAKEILNLAIWMMPSLIFICLFGFSSSLLQCEKQYLTVGIAPVAFNLIWTASAWALRHEPLPFAMWGMAIAVNAACLGQWLITLPFQKKILSKISIRGFIPSGIVQLLKNLSLGTLGVAAVQINSAIDPIFARIADPEGPAFLWYAIRIEQGPVGLFGVAFATALLPPLSRAVKAQDFPKVEKFLRFIVDKAIGLMIPLTFVMWLLSKEIVDAVYAHGAFQMNSGIQTTSCLLGYLIGLFPTILVIVMAPLFYAQGHFKTMAKSAWLSVLLNIALNALFIMVFKWGAASVAIATSIAAWFNLGYLLYNNRFSGLPSLVSFFTNGWRTLSASLIAYTMTRFLMAETLAIPSFVALGVWSLCFIIILAAVGWIFKAEELMLWKKEERTIRPSSMFGR